MIEKVFVDVVLKNVISFTEKDFPTKEDWEKFKTMSPSDMKDYALKLVNSMTVENLVQPFRTKDVEVRREVLWINAEKHYVVDFYDMMDGWTGMWENDVSCQFDVLEDAQKFADFKFEKLDKQNKLAGEHYGIIDAYTGKEVYCTRVAW